MMSDFEKVDIDPTSSEARYERPDFAKVIFQNIPETYPTDAHVECKYIITASLVPTSRDWVGLYKVGWSHSRDYVYFLWSPMPDQYHNGTEVENSVLFQAHSLPKDDGEFYQFCYVSTTGHVRGASTPFQFKRPSAEEFVEIEDEDSDMMVIKTKSKALEESLASAIEEKELLNKRCKCLEQERESLLTKMVELNKEVMSEKGMKEELHNTLQGYIEKVATLQTDLKDITIAHDALREKLNFLNQEKQSIENRLDDNDTYIHSLQEKIKALINEKDSLTGRNKTLEQEKELLQNHFSTSENQVKGYLSEIMSLKVCVGELEEVKDKMKSEIEGLLADIDSQKDLIRTMENCAEKDKREREELNEKLRNAEDKLSACEKRKQLISEEMSAVNQAHFKISCDLEQAKSESHTLQRQLSRSEKQFAADELVWKQEIDALKIALEAKDQEIITLNSHLTKTKDKLKCTTEQKEAEKEGSLYALQTAHQHLKDRYAKMKSHTEELQRQIDDLVEQQKKKNSAYSDMEREIQDLKERLLMGADEYKIKYLECRKLQAELKKLRKQSARRSSLSMKTENIETSEANTNTERVIRSEANTNTESIKKSEANTNTDEVNKCEANTNTDKVMKMEADTNTVVEENQESWGQAEADLSASVVESQLEGFSIVLQERYAKMQKYKKLYPLEKEKNALLQKLYHEELAKKEEELNAKEEEIKMLQRKLQEEAEKAKQQSKKLEGAVHSSISPLNSPFALPVSFPPHHTVSHPYTSNTLPLNMIPLTPPTIPLPPANMFPVQAPPPSAITPSPIHPYPFPHPYTMPVQYRNPLESYSPPARLTYPAQYPLQTNPFIREANRGQQVMHIKKETRPLKKRGLRIDFPTEPVSEMNDRCVTSHCLPQTSMEAGAVAAGDPAKIVMEMDPLVTGEPPAELEVPLTPLPPPIQPEVLATAKVAAVKAVNGDLLRGDRETEGNIDDVTFEKMLVQNDEPEQDEDRFHDADGEPQKLCPVCNTVFPADLPQGQFEDHVDSHYSPVCPMCHLQFPIGFEQEDFERHVNGHFSDNNEFSDEL